MRHSTGNYKSEAGLLIIATKLAITLIAMLMLPLLGSAALLFFFYPKGF